MDCTSRWSGLYDPRKIGRRKNSTSLLGDFPVLFVPRHGGDLDGCGYYSLGEICIGTWFASMLPPNVCAEDLLVLSTGLSLPRPLYDPFRGP